MVSWPKSVTPKKLILAVVVLGMVALAVWFFIFRGFVAGPLDSIKLSNGKVIFLGQSVKSLRQVMGKDITEYNNNTWSYPSEDEATIKTAFSVLIYVRKGHIGAIQIIKDRKSLQLQTDLAVHKTIKDLNESFPGELKLTTISLPRGRKLTYYMKSNSTRTNSYYFTNPCSTGDRIIVLAVAFKEYENDAKTGAPGCSTIYE